MAWTFTTSTDPTINPPAEVTGASQEAGASATRDTGAGWFSRLFGYNQTEDPTIPNYASNGVDVPMNFPATVVMWDKYGLDYGAPAGYSGAGKHTENNQQALSQTWYSSMFQGIKAGAKFVFCPIFTECPAPLPPGGITVGGVLGSAGKAVGDGVSATLSPLMPLLIILVVGLVLVNVILTKAGTLGSSGAS